MGKGIALQFKEAYPENYRLYREACKNNLVRVGEMFITQERTLNGTRTIINFPTKTTWKKPSEYSYIESGLFSLRNEIITRHIPSIAIPPLGSNNGGLDWFRVKNLIISYLTDLDNCEVYIYEPSDVITEKMKSERVKLTPARAMMLDILCDMKSYGEFASVFAAEKAVYFLQRMGAKDTFKVEFISGYYGPYSKGKIAHVLYYLNGSYIKGMGGMEIKPFEELWILPDTPTDVSNYLDDKDREEYKEICNKTKDFLRGYYSTYSLELLSTVDFIFQKDKRLSSWKGMDEDELITVINDDLRQWSPRKESLFGNSKYLPDIVEHLRNL